MPWKEMTFEQVAKSLGVNPAEVREKHRLIGLIVKVRKGKGMSQTALAKKIGVTQGRIAQIESGIGTSRVTFDVLLNLLNTLGYDYKIVPRLAA